MTFGRPYYKQCENKPTWIATEKKPNKMDGLIGSMSLCDKCKDVLIRIKGKHYAKLEPIK